MRLIFYSLFSYSFLFNALFAMLESQKAKDREEINQILNNADAKLRLKFTSDENFKQFKLLKEADVLNSAADDLTRKFLNAAIDNNTITEEELCMFNDCSAIRDRLSKREWYNIESMCQEIAFKDEKIIDRVQETSGSFDKLIKKKKREAEKREKRITSRIFWWFDSNFIDEQKENKDQKKEDIKNEEGIMSRIWNWFYWPFAREKEENLNQKDMDEKEKKLELEEKKK